MCDVCAGLVSVCDRWFVVFVKTFRTVGCLVKYRCYPSEARLAVLLGVERRLESSLRCGYVVGWYFRGVGVRAPLSYWRVGVFCFCVFSPAW